jgi:type II secretory ATPase GspE/PulE/Tfp pilus assembly ATPase PilB-like protein
MMELWHTASNKVPATKEQEEWLQKMKDFASKNNLTRTHDHAETLRKHGLHCLSEVMRSAG